MGLVHEGVQFLQRTDLICPQQVLLLQGTEDEGCEEYWWIHGRMSCCCCQSGFLREVLGFESSKEED